MSKKKIRGGGFAFSKKEDRLLKKYYGTISEKKLRALYFTDRPPKSLGHRAKILGIHSSREQVSKNHRKYSINDNYFTKYTLNSCYWAGFLAADGCLRDSNEMVLQLNNQDVKQLELFKNHISSTHPIKSCPNNMSKLVWASGNMKKDLINNFNVTPHKTFTLKPPPIKDWNFKLAFLIGLIDGDGCITKTIVKPKIWTYEKLTFSIFATHDILVWMTDIFKKIQKNINIKSDHLYRHTKTHAAFQASSYEMFQILKKLNNINVPKMQRKWDKVSEFNYVTK